MTIFLLYPLFVSLISTVKTMVSRFIFKPVYLADILRLSRFFVKNVRQNVIQLKTNVAPCAIGLLVFMMKVTVTESTIQNLKKLETRFTAQCSIDPSITQIFWWTANFHIKIGIIPTNCSSQLELDGFRWREWIPHMPFLFDKVVLADLQNIFSAEYNQTSSHRFRAKNDVQTEFSYFHFLKESLKYPSIVIDSFP